MFRTLRSFGVYVDQSATPAKSFLPTRPQSDAAAAARIDDSEEKSTGVEWQVVPNYQDAEEGDSVWTLKARDDAGLEKAKKVIADAINQAEGSSLVGFLTLPDRSAFPRIVGECISYFRKLKLIVLSRGAGAKGANVSRLRQETGADITVSREENVITIIGEQDHACTWSISPLHIASVGSESSIEAAKEAILRIHSNRGRRGD